MFQPQEMMYNMYAGQNPNGNGGYSVYGSGQQPGNMYGNMHNMHNPGQMMYMYNNNSNGNGASNGGAAGNLSAVGGAYGMHIDPAYAATYEYNGINNMNMNMRGQGGRGGGYAGNNAMSNPNMPRRGGYGYGRGGNGGGGYDQQVTSDYEVHDNQLKAPVAVTMETVVSTIGSNRLFSRPPKPIVYGSRSVVRICDAFQEGRCVAGDKCHDIHVRPEFLTETRMQMSSWLMDRENEFRQTLETDPSKSFRIFVADLKEVVEVPVGSLVFTKGLYVDPTTRAKRARGGGNHAHAVMQVPTSCGLYSTDPAQCKWGRWCNQVHIDHQWMQSKKDEFDNWFNELQNRYFALSPDSAFTVHDPQLKASISLPKFSIAGFSRGLFQGSMKKLASVCLLYQRGKCTAGSCCNQIHVVPQYLSLAREYAALEQSPEVPAEEKQRVAHEMEMLRGPCVEQQQREQLEAERAAAEVAAARPVAANPLNRETEGQESANGGGDDELGSSGALFEHVQVDEDVEPVSRPASGNTSLTRRLNSSAPDINLSGGRQLNSDGSYSFNPYGSVTSLPDASASYGRASTGRGAGLPLESGGGVQFTPGNVQLHATTAKGTRRMVAVVSPETSNSMNDAHRTDEMGTSGTADGCLSSTAMDRHSYASAQSRGAYRSAAAATHQRPYGDGPFDQAAHNEPSSTLHPLEFEASLHFSPSPLLNFDASSTSLYRNGSTREEEAVTNLNMRLAASNTSAPYPGGSTNSHPYMGGASQQGGGAYSAAKNRFSTSNGALRQRPQYSGASLTEMSGNSMSNPNMSASTHSNPTARPAEHQTAH